MREREIFFLRDIPGAEVFFSLELTIKICLHRAVNRKFEINVELKNFRPKMLQTSRLTRDPTTLE